jgi:YHS domain-containing protein
MISLCDKGTCACHEIRVRLSTTGEYLMAIDPVCGMDVEETAATGKSEYKGQIYYFCSTGCKRSFDKDPEKYLGKTQQPSEGGSHH